MNYHYSIEFCTRINTNVLIFADVPTSEYSTPTAKWGIQQIRDRKLNSTVSASLPLPLPMTLGILLASWHKSILLTCYEMLGMLTVPICMCLSKSPGKPQGHETSFQSGTWSTSIEYCAWTQAFYIYLSTNQIQSLFKWSSFSDLQKNAHKGGRLHTRLSASKKNQIHLAKTRKQQKHSQKHDDIHEIVFSGPRVLSFFGSEETFRCSSSARWEKS